MKTRYAWIWPVLLAFTVFTLSGATRIATPNLGFQFSKDKLGHFLVFGLLATSILRVPLIQAWGRKGIIAAALLTIGFGAFDELRQSLTPGRSVEFADWIADCLGAIVAVFAYQFLTPYRRILEWRVQLGRKSNKKVRLLFRRTGP
ncbi:MAG: VanZ family protein [Opitutales bacterium]